MEKRPKPFVHGDHSIASQDHRPNAFRQFLECGRCRRGGSDGEGHPESIEQMFDTCNR